MGIIWFFIVLLVIYFILGPVRSLILVSAIILIILAFWWRRKNIERQERESWEKKCQESKRFNELRQLKEELDEEEFNQFLQLAFKRWSDHELARGDLRLLTQSAFERGVIDEQKLDEFFQFTVEQRALDKQQFQTLKQDFQEFKQELQENVEFKRKEQELQRAVAERIQSIVRQHVATLARKYDQTVYKDDYGNDLYDKWLCEFNYFQKNVLFNDDALMSTVRPIGWDDQVAMDIIMNAIRDYKHDKSGDDTYLSVNVDALDPIAFEHYCADILKKHGWDVRVTQASGDQGIDLIANRGNVKAVFQCKKYSQPVGNSAVQEIIAGKQFEQANIAAVISNNSYTPSAKQLANTAGVYLLHYTELEQFSQKTTFNNSL